MSNPSALDEIDRVVDQTIADKDRASKLKQALHQQYDLTRPGIRAEAKGFSAAYDDVEDFWDNVPV